MPAKVLIIEDDHEMCAVLERALTRRGFDITATTDPQEALHRLVDHDFDAIVTDLNMPRLNGIDVCSRANLNRPDTPVILITAFGSMDTAIEAMRAGAYDFITKPVDTDHLALVMERAFRHRQLREEVKRLRREVSGERADDGMIGRSEALARLRDLVRRAAATDSSVLITGESGVGKELVATAIHRSSPRASGPFIALHCGAMPAQLLESELFGHRKGSFTDARQDREGMLLQARGGTLFLDEIATMPVDLQPKLLRVLQERRFRPVGSDHEIAFDARIVAATNADIESVVEEGGFRDDLFYRLNVIHIAVPPLRSRGQDTLLLAQHFVQRYARRMSRSVTGISTGAAEKLLSYPWPGNVRELQHCIERAVALTQFEQILVEDLPEKIRDYHRSHVVIAADDPAELLPMDEVERRYVLRVIEAVQGNKTEAARVLGVDRKTLYRKLEKWLETHAT